MMTCAVYIENILHNLYSAVIKEWRHSGTSYPRFTWNMAIKMEREIKEIGVDLFGQYQLFVNALMHAVHACNLMKPQQSFKKFFAKFTAQFTAV